MNAHGLSAGASTVPQFLVKLRLLVDDEDTNDLIYWDPDGTSFHICDGNRLAKEVLPLFFKHNNLSSFIRQLNMYGFRKISRVDPMPFKSDVEDMEFSHPYFIRNKEHLLYKIQRKATSSGIGSNYLGGRVCNTLGVTTLTPSVISGVNNSFNNQTIHRPITSTDFYKLADMVKSLSTHQETMSHQLSLLKSENQLLYRELSELREHHHSQSQIIQTLFSFLSAFAKDSRTTNLCLGPTKRKALPFVPSGSNFPTTGIKLDLPAGYESPSLAQNIAFQSDNLLERPPKVPKLAMRSFPTKFLTSNSPLPKHAQLSQFTQNSGSAPVQVFQTNLRLTPTGLSSDGRCVYTLTTSNNSGTENNSDSNIPQTATPVAFDLQPQTMNQGIKLLNSSSHDLIDPNVPDDDESLVPNSEVIIDDIANMDHDDLVVSELDLPFHTSDTPGSLIHPDSLDLSDFLTTKDEEPDICLDNHFMTNHPTSDLMFEMGPNDLGTPSRDLDYFEFSPKFVDKNNDHAMNPTTLFDCTTDNEIDDRTHENHFTRLVTLASTTSNSSTCLITSTNSTIRTMSPSAGGCNTSFTIPDSLHITNPVSNLRRIRSNTVVRQNPVPTKAIPISLNQTTMPNNQIVAVPMTTSAANCINLQSNSVENMNVTRKNQDSHSGLILGNEIILAESAKPYTDADLMTIFPNLSKPDSPKSSLSNSPPVIMGKRNSKFGESRAILPLLSPLTPRTPVTSNPSVSTGTDAITKIGMGPLETPIPSPSFFETGSPLSRQNFITSLNTPINTTSSVPSTTAIAGSSPSLTLPTNSSKLIHNPLIPVTSNSLASIQMDPKFRRKQRISTSLIRNVPTSTISQTVAGRRNLGQTPPVSDKSNPNAPK